jgi:hypothetical protein
LVLSLQQDDVKLAEYAKPVLEILQVKMTAEKDEISVLITSCLQPRGAGEPSAGSCLLEVYLVQ